MSKQRFTPERERRFLAEPVEIRAAADDGDAPMVRGYAAVFNKESVNLGGSEHQFREVIKQGAFDDVLDGDVRALFNHDPNFILARSKNGEGSLDIGVDEHGLWYEFEAPDTQAGRDLTESIKRGDIDQSSFSFSVSEEGQSWEEREDSDGRSVTIRTITKASGLFDVSPVTYPAYPDASVAVRCLEQFKENNKEEFEESPETAWAAFEGFDMPINKD